MRDEPAIIMRRPDGVEHPLYGVNAAAVAARRIERDGWEQVSPAVVDPEREPDPTVLAAPVPQPVPQPELEPKPARPAKRSSKKAVEAVEEPTE